MNWLQEKPVDDRGLIIRHWTEEDVINETHKLYYGDIIIYQELATAEKKIIITYPLQDETRNLTLTEYLDLCPSRKILAEGVSNLLSLFDETEFEPTRYFEIGDYDDFIIGYNEPLASVESIIAYFGAFYFNVTVTEQTEFETGFNSIIN